MRKRTETQKEKDFTVDGLENGVIYSIPLEKIKDANMESPFRFVIESIEGKPTVQIRRV